MKVGVVARKQKRESIWQVFLSSWESVMVPVCDCECEFAMSYQLDLSQGNE